MCRWLKGKGDGKSGVGIIMSDDIAEGVIEGKEGTVAVTVSGGGYGLACSVASI